MLSIYLYSFILALILIKSKKHKQEAIDLCIKILTKTMDSPTLDADQLELCTLRLDDKGTPKYHQFDSKELDQKIKAYQEAHKDDEDDD